MSRKFLATAATLATVLGVVAFGAAPAQAACGTSNLKPHSVYNINCSWAQHAVERQSTGWNYGWRVGPCTTAYSSAYNDETGRYSVVKSNVQVSYC